MQLLLANISKLHTTSLGELRIRRNLGINNCDVVATLARMITADTTTIVRQGKNYYASTPDCRITINASSFTIITVHLLK